MMLSNGACSSQLQCYTQSQLVLELRGQELRVAALNEYTERLPDNDE